MFPCVVVLLVSCRCDCPVVDGLCLGDSICATCWTRLSCNTRPFSGPLSSDLLSMFVAAAAAAVTVAVAALVAVNDGAFFILFSCGGWGEEDVEVVEQEEED